MLTLDHLVVACTDLVAATAELEAQLGYPLAPGGKHGAMGTHNRLLSLGPDLYLELIAIDPAAPVPDQPRWYALDTFTGPAQLTHWAARVVDLDKALAQAPHGAGTPWDLTRGDLKWRMGVTATGQTPFDGAFPALLQWQTALPAPRLPDHGLRLQRLTLGHPDADGLRRALGRITEDPLLRLTHADTSFIRAELTGPKGTHTL